MASDNDVEQLRPEDFELPENSVVFVFDGGVSMAMIGAPPVESRLLAEAVYRLVTSVAGDGKKASLAVTRGLACLDMSLH